MAKIMFFNHSATIGGIFSTFSTYAIALNKKHEVIFVHNLPASDRGKEMIGDVRLICLNVNKFRNSLPKLISLINTERPDVLISGGDQRNVFCLLASRLSKVHPKVLMSQHNYINVEYNSLVHKLCYRFYNRADGVLAVSRGIKEFLIDEGVREDKVILQYNPIDIEKTLRMAECEPDVAITGDYMMFLGRLDPVKNLYYLIDAFGLVHQQFPNLKLVLVGDGQEKDNLMKHVNEKRLSEYVVFTGLQANPYAFLKRAKAMILSSFSEALPTVVIEALTLGKTVVTTPTNGALDLLDNGRLGYFTTKFDDAAEMSEKIVLALNQPFDETMLKNESKNFSVDKKVQELENIIANL